MINLDYGASGSMANALSRLDTIVDAAPGTTLASFTYLGLDTTVQMSYPQPGVQLTLIGTPGGDGGDQYVGLDRFGRLVDQRWMNSASTDIERVQYGYTPASNRIWRHNTVAAALGVGQDEYYAEDGLYQLSVRQQGTLNSGRTGISGTPAAEEDFTYDPTGNWANYETKATGTVTLNQPRTHNVDNEILTLSGSASLVSYDHVGNMTTAPQPAAGTSAYKLIWDAWNRLVKVATASPSSTVAVYAYDGLTRRTRKTVGTTTNDFYYSDQWKVLEVDMLTGSTASLKQFVWRGCAEDKLILCDEPAGASIPRLYALDDGKNVTAVCDTTGTVQERYGYSGFGAPVFMNASFVAQAVSSYGWETLFCGYLFDTETGLYQVRHRYYHPELGRWTARDLLILAEFRQGENLYLYLGNRPLIWVDGFGLGCCDAEEAAANAAQVAVANAQAAYNTAANASIAAGVAAAKATSALLIATIAVAAACKTPATLLQCTGALIAAAAAAAWSIHELNVLEKDTDIQAQKAQALIAAKQAFQQANEAAAECEAAVWSGS